MVCGMCVFGVYVSVGGELCVMYVFLWGGELYVVHVCDEGGVRVCVWCMCGECVVYVGRRVLSEWQGCGNHLFVSNLEQQLRAKYSGAGGRVV